MNKEENQERRLGLEKESYPTLEKCVFLIVDDRCGKINSIKKCLFNIYNKLTITEKRGRVRDIKVENMMEEAILEKIIYQISNIVYFHPKKDIYLLFDHYIYLKKDKEGNPGGKCVYGGEIIDDLLDYKNGKISFKPEIKNRIIEYIIERRCIDNEILNERLENLKINTVMTTADPDDCIEWLNTRFNSSLKEMLTKDTINDAYGSFDIMRVIEVDPELLESDVFLKELQNSI